MADITVTAASVVKASGTAISGTLGETVTAGQTVYLKSADSRYWKALTTSAETSGSGGLGIALNGGAAGQPVSIQTSGVITIGATVAVGTIYVLSDTAGGICPAADNGSADYVTILGIASTTGAITLGISASGIAKA